MKKRILIAPLNWGLGHATRCIPIINSLLHFGYEPVIASDGAALNYLKKEFPKLTFITLPSYNITYPERGSFKWHLFRAFPRIINTIKKERAVIEKIIDSERINGIISDNRFGVYSKKVPCVYLTHQLNVLSGNTTWWSSKWHQRVIRNYDECWVPDNQNNKLSGTLAVGTGTSTKIKYIGPLSRLEKQKSIKHNELLVLLSGPEPQRTAFEKMILSQLHNFDKSAVVVRGVIEPKQLTTVTKKIKIYNYMTTNELALTINKSRLILARSGYSTIMDLAKLGEKAFFVPTPGQYEQEYLAKHLEALQIAPFCAQKEFELNKLNDVNAYTGFENIAFPKLNEDLFRLF